MRNWFSRSEVRRRFFTDHELQHRRRADHKPTKGLNLESLEARYLLTTVSGTINADATWDLAGSPYEVIADLTIATGATLRIEPGVTVAFTDDTQIQVDGRLLAEGKPASRITFRPGPSASTWDGLRFQASMADNRIAYAEFTGGDGAGSVIDVSHSRLNLDHIRWEGTPSSVLNLTRPSLIVRNSQFPTTDQLTARPVIQGQSLLGNDYLIVENNRFPDSQHSGDVIQFSNSVASDSVVQILNNMFLGGGDDGIQLESTNAYIEGNQFSNFSQRSGNLSTANAIAAVASRVDVPAGNVTVVRNVFRDTQYALLVDDQSFAVVDHNVFFGMTESAIQFDESQNPTTFGVGDGASLDGNVFANLPTTSTGLFKHLSNSVGFQTALTVNNSLLPSQEVLYGGVLVDSHSFGTGNLAGDPQFFDPAAGNFRLRPQSPAIGTGPNGLDQGAYVAAGPSVTGIPDTTSDGSELWFQVGGPGITHYRYRLNQTSYSPSTSIDTPIHLTDLPTDYYTLDVIGRNAAGEWFAGATPSFGERTAQIIAPTRARTGEQFPIVIQVLDSNDSVNRQFSDVGSFLGNGTDLDADTFEYKKGIASLSPIVTANTDFDLQIDPESYPELATSPQRNVAILDASFPIQTYSGTLTGNLVWDNSVERHITGDLTIPAGSSLTIQAGTRVLLGDRVNIDATGNLTAEGTQADPVLFNAIDATLPWGGIELTNGAVGIFRYTFLTNAAADATRNFGHSSSQPVIFVEGGQLDFRDSYILNTVGKAFGSDDAIITIDSAIISNVDTGAQFDDSLITTTNSTLKDIPNGDGIFDDDDNDGFYFLGAHRSGAFSLFKDSYILDTKDDGIDHNGANLNVVGSWIEGALHEGIATSSSRNINIVDTVVTGNNQGIEAGWGGPNVTIENSVAFDNNERADPATSSLITAGIRFGDGYDGGNGGYSGHIDARNLVVYDNEDNVRNWDGSIPGPTPDAIDITYSMTNDTDYDSDLGNFDGLPVFGPNMHLLQYSDGLGVGSDGENVGRLTPSLQRIFRVVRPDTTPPPPPENLTGQTTGHAEATLTWDPTVDPESGTDNYNVYRDGVLIGSTAAATDPIRFIDPDATIGVVHLYTVKVVNGVGAEGPAASIAVQIQPIDSFQDGKYPDATYVGTSDTWLRGSQPDTPQGAGVRMDADGSDAGTSEWSLVRWDVSSIPGSPSVAEVQLQLTINNASANSYSLYAVNRDWVESEATFNDWASGQSWETPGTGPADRGVLVGVFRATQTGTHVTTLNQEGIQLVQSWIDNPQTNRGLILYGASSSDGLEIRTREYANADQRPKLQIQTTVPGPNLAGDYNRNGSVDMLDYDLWKSTFNSTTVLYADGNGNGMVDAADFPYWRDRLGNTLPSVASEAATADSAEDVNNDGQVTPIDALIVINALNASSSVGTSSSDRAVTHQSAGTLASADNLTERVDVNLDGDVTPIDALLVINRLNRAEATASAPKIGFSTISYPPTDEADGEGETELIDRVFESFDDYPWQDATTPRA